MELFNKQKTLAVLIRELELLVPLTENSDANEGHFTSLSRKILDVRNLAESLGQPRIASILKLAVSVAVRASHSRSGSLSKKCISCLWDVLTTSRYMLENPREFAEIESILLNRLQWTLRALEQGEPLGKRMLVVDDEECLRDVFSRIFKNSGAEIFQAENIEKAYGVLTKNRIDMLFSDVRMPGGSGIELVRKINSELYYKPKVFLCTGFSDVTEAEAESLGVLSIFPKPFNSKDMLQVIAAS